LNGYSLEEAVWRGQIAARYACTQKASSSRLITTEIMQHYFER